jgi:ubiquinone/menaquinone biosynthesis C-methylase UbiE
MALLGIRNIKPVWANLEILGATKIEKESVDLVLLVNILFQSKKHKEIFEEAKRVLKKDGTLLVIDWKKTEAPMGPEILIRVDKDQLRHQAEEVGFKLVRETEASPYHYELVFIK